MQSTEERITKQIHKERLKVEIMKEFRIENNKIYSKSGLCEKTDIFEIVDKIPSGFFVWNIGENMGSDEYIPLAQDLKSGDKESFEINPYTLKAIKLDSEEVKLLRNAASVGVNNRITAEKALKSKRKGYWSNRKREQAEKTIEIFNRITA
jgi:hypothetical protein